MRPRSGWRPGSPSAPAGRGICACASPRTRLASPKPSTGWSRCSTEEAGMYVPPHFRQDERTALHQAIRDARLATIVTLGNEGLEASHVPVLLDAADGPHGAIRGHLAKANAQWRCPARGT